MGASAENIRIPLDDFTSSKGNLARLIGFEPTTPSVGGVWRGFVKWLFHWGPVGCAQVKQNMEKACKPMSQLGLQAVLLFCGSSSQIVVLCGQNKNKP